MCEKFSRLELVRAMSLRIYCGYLLYDQFVDEQAKIPEFFMNP